MSLSLTENRIRRLAPDTFKVRGHNIKFHSAETFANFDNFSLLIRVQLSMSVKQKQSKSDQNISLIAQWNDY